MDSRVVLITGADTGFGFKASTALIGKGYKVLACCLTQHGIKDLMQNVEQKFPQSKHLLKTAILDVTKSADIAALRAGVEKDYPNGIYALVNNAGIARSAPLELCDEMCIRTVMEVNFFGAVYMMRAFIPSLRKYAQVAVSKPKNERGPKPRIINITSIAAHAHASPLSMYCASKAALTAATNVVRVEVKPFGILVANIQPYFAKTPIIVPIPGVREKLLSEASQEVRDAYGVDYGKEASTNDAAQIPLCLNADYCVDVIVNNITNENPRGGWIGLGAYIGYFLSFFPFILGLLMQKPAMAVTW